MREEKGMGVGKEKGNGRGEMIEVIKKGFNCAFSPHRDLALPDVLGLLGDEVADLSVDVTRRDGVCTSKLDPFDGEGAAFMIDG